MRKNNSFLYLHLLNGIAQPWFLFLRKNNSFHTYIFLMLRFSASTLEVSAAMDALQTNAESYHGQLQWHKRKPILKFPFHHHPFTNRCGVLSINFPGMLSSLLVSGFWVV
ncbi:hypothetical protein V8G54_016124 [Vigna mungo]|uniref:Uncharacterized protein n=1 Tax=Vigna mungo TaxID=3915 RepID=A0AAQ3NJN5_VIGMU